MAQLAKPANTCEANAIAWSSFETKCVTDDTEDFQGRNEVVPNYLSKYYDPIGRKEDCGQDGHKMVYDRIVFPPTDIGSLYICCSDRNANPYECQKGYCPSDGKTSDSICGNLVYQANLQGLSLSDILKEKASQLTSACPPCPRGKRGCNSVTIAILAIIIVILLLFIAFRFYRTKINGY